WGGERWEMSRPQRRAARELRISGCQRGRELAELGRGGRGTANRGLLCSIVEFRSDGRARSFYGKRVVARTFLHVCDGGRQDPVNCTPLPDRCLLVTNRREQRMGKTDARVVELDHAFSNTSLERSQDALAVPVRNCDQVDC